MSAPDVSPLPPPHSIESEQGLLSSMMQGGAGVVEEARAKIGPEAFYAPAHRLVFMVLCTMRENDMPTNDLILITNTMRDQNYLEKIGGVNGAAVLTELFTFVPSPVNFESYLQIVREKFMLREAIRFCTETIRRAYEEQDDAHGLVEDLQSNVIEIGHLASADETSRPLAAFVPDALKQIEATYHGRGKCSGISTGFVDLDRTMNGFEAPLTYYFAARPAMGKSALMIALAEHIAISAAEQRRRVQIFSIEMTGQMLAKRLICSRADIKLKDLRHGFMDHTALERAATAAEALTTDYIRIDEKGDLSIFEFRARARRAVLRDKCELIMIDYLQRMKGSSKRAAMSRELEINEIAQGISATAKELRVPIVVLAQLNRKPEERKDGKPELGDLRESGSIEQEARFVGLLWRPKYYANSDAKRTMMKKDLGMEPGAESDTEFDQYAECIVAKQNEGPVGPVPLRFVEAFARYEPQDPDRPLYSNNPAARQEIKKPPAESKAHPLIEEAREIFGESPAPRARNQELDL